MSDFTEKRGMAPLDDAGLVATPLVIYVRTKGVAPEDRPRRFGPKSADHPSMGTLCPACWQPFAGGDWTTLIPLGPGEDPEARAKAASGRYFSAIALEVHYACATGIETP